MIISCRLLTSRCSDIYHLKVNRKLIDTLKTGVTNVQRVTKPNRFHNLYFIGYIRYTPKKIKITIPRKQNQNTLVSVNRIHCKVLFFCYRNTYFNKCHRKGSFNTREFVLLCQFNTAKKVNHSIQCTQGGLLKTTACQLMVFI